MGFSRAEREAGGCKIIMFWGNLKGVLKNKTSLAESRWKAGTKEGNSPVSENGFMLLVINLEYLDTRKGREKQGELTPKAKYFRRSIADKYREGKVKSSPVRAVK